MFGESYWKLKFFLPKNMLALRGTWPSDGLSNSSMLKMFVLESWEACAPLPTTLYSTACCVYKEDIYMFGPRVFCYRQAIANWEVISNINLPDNMAVGTAMSDNEVIYVIGKIIDFISNLKINIST